MRSRNLGECGKSSHIIFYPLCYNSNILNGIGIADGYLALSDLFSIMEFSFIKFINDEIFLFQTRSHEVESQPFSYDGTLSTSEETKKTERTSVYGDRYSGNLNILKHIVLKSKRLKERERKCLLLALDFGFPCNPIVNFEIKSVSGEKSILSAWEKMIDHQIEDLEKDFITKLSKGIKVVLDEYSILFDKLRFSSKKNALPSLNLILAITELPFFSLPERAVLPKILFKKVLIKVIVHTDGRSLIELLNRIKTSLEGYGNTVKYRYEMGKGYDQSKNRIEVFLLITFSDFIPLNEMRYCLFNIKNRILDILKEIDQDSYKMFISRRIEEIWIKRIDLYVSSSRGNAENIRMLSRGFLSGTQKRFMTRSLNESTLAIKITFLFDRFSDFSISERKKYMSDEHTEMKEEQIYNPNDKYTRVAIEEIYAKNFNNASKYLRIAMHGLVGDLYSIRCRNLNTQKRRKLRIMANIRYTIAEADRFAGYLSRSSEDIVMKALRINGWWRASLGLYLKARDIQKQREWDKSMHKEKIAKMNRKLLRKYYQLQSRRNIDDFGRVMGDFYNSLLIEIQKECRDFTKKVLGYTF